MNQEKLLMRLLDGHCVLRLAVMMLAQKAGVDAIELMEDAQRTYDMALEKKKDVQ